MGREPVGKRNGISSAMEAIRGHIVGTKPGVAVMMSWRRLWSVAGKVVPATVVEMVSKRSIKPGAEVMGWERRVVRMGQKGTWPLGSSIGSGEGWRLKRSRQANEGEEGRR
jgi:hypothetical protein